MSTNFETEDAVDNFELIRDTDRKAVNIAKIIMQLKKELVDLQNVCIMYMAHWWLQRLEIVTLKMLKCVGLWTHKFEWTGHM